jgi:hypothetical protein
MLFSLKTLFKYLNIFNKCTEKHIISFRNLQTTLVVFEVVIKSKKRHTCTQGEGGWVGDTLCTPAKDHKNAIKHENRGPTPRFSHNSKYPLKRI